jgi:hypothetical protein
MGLFSSIGKGIKSVGKAVGLVDDKKEPPKPPAPTPEQVQTNLLKLPPAVNPMAGIGANPPVKQDEAQLQALQARQQKIAQAFLLAGLDPNMAKQFAIGGNAAQFQTSRAFTISGQQFLTSANPNIILGNLGFNMATLGLPPTQQAQGPVALNTVA